MATGDSLSTTITVSAPGKVILHGEHSVVYGKLAVAASLGLRTHLILKTFSSSQPNFSLKFPDVNLSLTISLNTAQSVILPEGLDPTGIDHDTMITNIETFLKTIPQSFDAICHNAIVITLYLYFSMIYPVGIPLQSMEIHIHSEIKVSAGMGSSASFAVCLAGGFFEYIKRRSNVEDVPKEFTTKEKHLISQWAFKAEKVTHGNPSGIDNSVCTFGSIVKFRKGEDPEPLQLENKLNGFLIDTNVPKDTKALVQKVAILKETLPEIVVPTLEAMEAVAMTAIGCLQKMNKGGAMDEHYQLLNTLVDMNQNMLRILGVSHPSIDHICLVLQKYGLHGKITGAGGGGYVLCLVPEHYDQGTLNEVKGILQREQYTCQFLELGGIGVRID